MKTTRHSPAELTRLAVCAATGEQKEKLTKMLETGWEVTGTLTSGYRTAISLYWKDSGLWPLPDGKIERPIKGQKSVRINTRTLERVW